MVAVIVLGSERKKNERYLAILRLLAEKGPLNKYAICREFVPAAASEPTILYSVRNLESEGSIKVVDVPREVRRSNRASDYFGLSLLGLAKVIGNLGENQRDRDLLNNVAKRYRELLPLAFDIWSASIDAGIGDSVRHQLVGFFNFLATSMQTLLRIQRTRNPSADDARVLQIEERYVRQHLDQMPQFLLGVPLAPFKLQDEVVNWPDPEGAVRKNEVLRRALLQGLHARIEMEKQIMSEATDTIRKVETLIERLEEKDEAVDVR